MKITNKYINNFFSLAVYFVLFIITSCSTSHQVKEIVGDYERHPVYEKSLPWQDPKLTKLDKISHAFVSSKDTFVITLIDKNENNVFTNAEDVIVISTLRDSVAPIIPSNSSNAAFYVPDLEFDFYGNKYKVLSLSSDGKQVTIGKMKSKQGFQIQALVTDQISPDLSVLELKSSSSYSLLETIQAQGRKYILLDFWLPSCTQCFENIPMLKQLDKNGVGIVNLFHIDDDELMLVEKDITKFKIPGINFRSSPKLIKYFSQNGFPFYVLIDVYENKILLSSHRIVEIEAALKL